MSKESPSEWAGSVLMTTVRYPAAAQRTAVAAATDVLPTPPFPVKRTTLTGVSRILRLGGFPRLSGPFFGRHLVDVFLDERFDVAEDRQRRGPRAPGSSGLFATAGCRPAEVQVRCTRPGSRRRGSAGCTGRGRCGSCPSPGAC